jgi:hypothetical protein
VNKLILLFALFALLSIDKTPVDITGKWKVDSIDVGDAPIMLPIEQKNMALMMATEIFRDAMLDFKTDHTCTITPNKMNLPNNCKWVYNAGAITITGTQNGKTRTMLFTAVDKGGKTYFTLQKSPVGLRVHKL